MARESGRPEPRRLWEPLSLAEAGELFSDAPFRWWIGGGHALELHIGRSWRQHADMDIGVVRADAPAVFEWLTGWDLAVAAGGRLSWWDGSPLADGQNNVWGRREDRSCWEIDLTVGSGTEDEWIYRRDASIRRSWPEAVLRAGDGVPYLAPDLQLLFKSKAPRPKDDEDAGVVIPLLGGRERQLLLRWLPGDHPWRELLAG